MGASDRGHVFCTGVELLEGNSRVPQKSLSCKCRADAPGMALKQGCPQVILQVTNASADGRGFNVKRGSGLPKASVFRRRDEIAEMAEFRLKKHLRHH